MLDVKDGITMHPETCGKCGLAMETSWVTAGVHDDMPREELWAKIEAMRTKPNAHMCDGLPQYGCLRYFCEAHIEDHGKCCRLQTIVSALLDPDSIRD